MPRRQERKEKEDEKQSEEIRKKRMRAALHEGSQLVASHVLEAVSTKGTEHDGSQGEAQIDKKTNECPRVPAGAHTLTHTRREQSH